MGEGETVEQKSLVPYDEVEEPKTNEESVDEDGQGQAEQEKEEGKPKMDPTKFINSFSEAVVEEVKPKRKLPTLIFNEKTVELAPREEVKPETEASEPRLMFTRKILLSSWPTLQGHKTWKPIQRNSKTNQLKGHRGTRKQKKKGQGTRKPK